MSERVKVVFCTNGVFPHKIGGMQRHSRLLIEALDASGEVELVVVHPHEAGILSECSHVTEVPIPGMDPRKNYLWECWKYSKRVSECLRKYPDCLVYSQGLPVWNGIAEMPQKVVINPHGLESFQAITFKDWAIGIPFRAIYNGLFRKADQVVSLGGKLTPILRGRLPGQENKVVVLPNATNISETAGRVAKQRRFGEKTRFLFVARFAQNKGIRYLMEAVKQLNDGGYADRTHFDLVGTGPLHDEISNRYQLPNVKFHGRVEDEELIDLYTNNDVFLFPTLFEGMPTVILEAMSWGLPIVSTDTGAVAELVDEENGLIIERQSASAVMEAVKHFCGLPPERKQALGAASFTRVAEKFKWTAVAERHLELFRELAATTE